MSGRDADEGSARAGTLARHRRRATWCIVLGAVLTVLGFAGLVLTAPMTAEGPNPMRAWAVCVVVVGLVTTVLALISRAAPMAEQPPSRPRTPVWALLTVAGMGLVTLVATARTGSDDPLRYVSPGLLTVYPFVTWAYESWRHRRSAASSADARVHPSP